MQQKEVDEILPDLAVRCQIFVHWIPCKPIGPKSFGDCLEREAIFKWGMRASWGGHKRRREQRKEAESAWEETELDLERDKQEHQEQILWRRLCWGGGQEITGTPALLSALPAYLFLSSSGASYYHHL